VHGKQCAKKDMNRFLPIFIVLVCVFTVVQVQAQSLSVSGVVSDEQGNPLPGVSIQVKGTTRGAVTDAKGVYSIANLSTESALVFSFIGFLTQETIVGNRSAIDIRLLEDVETLDELVVVGYGLQRKSDITGATASVKGDELFKQPVLTATQAMQGKVAGVQIISSGQPGSVPQIRVRGVGTALGGTTSLFVVDGVLTDDISNINTAEITEINVLKDASAAAIYGSRGANGVIIITTKKGAPGKLKINYNNNIGFRQAANLVEMANASEYANYMQAATGEAPPPSVYNTDWYDVILRTALQQNHNLSVSGGSETATYLVNAGYLQDQGILLNNDFTRWNLRINTEFKLSPKLSFSLQSAYNNNVNENGFGNIDIDPFGNIGAVYNNAYRAAPIIPARVNGLYGNTSGYQNVGNALLDLNNNDIRVVENRFQGSGSMAYKVNSAITLRSAIGGDWRNSLNRGYYYEFRSDENTFIVPGGNQQRPISSLSVKQSQNFRWVWDNTITYLKDFGDHSINVLAGITAEKYNLTWFSASRNDVPADRDLWYIGVGDANTSQNGGGGDAWARNSYLGRVNYSYQEKYLLTATFRVDGSSRLPNVNRWQSYPSVGVGWQISKESFMDNQQIFDNLKLRASYGRVGNDQIPTNAFTQTVNINRPYSFNGSTKPAQNGALIDQIIDPNINWETTEEFDLALEFGFLKGKLNGEINYYNKSVKNALIFVPVPRTVGDADGVILTNAASIQNNGLEVLLNWRDQISESFSYSVGGNVTFNKNEVTALNGGQAIRDAGIGAAQGFVTYTDNGQSVGTFHVLQVLGVFNTADEVQNYVNSNGTIIQPNAKPGDFKYLDKNGDGRIDDDDRVFAGSYQPVAYFGINGSINYKNWDFSLDIYGNVGNEVYNGKKAVRVEGRDNVEKDIVYNRWTSGGRSQTEPGANTGNQLASTYFVEPGDFIRINNITVGYRFNKELVSKFKMQSLRAFVTAQNPLVLQRYSGFTAELPGGPTTSGIELSAYPTTRTIAIGVNVEF
jgi:TonB-linked SusC/RagA family outer membrane protein